MSNEEGSVGKFKFVVAGAEKAIPVKRRNGLNAKKRKIISSFHKNKFTPIPTALEMLLGSEQVEPWIWGAVITHPNINMDDFAAYLFEMAKDAKKRSLSLAPFISISFKTLIGHWSSICDEVKRELISFIITNGTSRDILLINLYFSDFIRSRSDCLKSALVFSNYSTRIDFLADLFFEHAKGQKFFMKLADRFGNVYQEAAYDF